jgi:hypothetical protein
MSIFDWPITIKSIFEHSQKKYIVISSLGLLTHSSFNILKDSISSLPPNGSVAPQLALKKKVKKKFTTFCELKKKILNYFRGGTRPHPEIIARFKLPKWK